MFNHTMGIQESVKHAIYLQKEKKGIQNIDPYS
jgi:hypothetical protein